MIEPLNMGFAMMEGALLGTFFFGGLWWTVRKAVTARNPAFWFLGSMLLRTSIVVTGFYFILGDNWQRLLAGLLGFIVARHIVMRLTQQASSLTQEASHAP